MFEQLRKVIYIWSSIILGGAIIGLVAIVQILMYYGKDLPDYHQLETYDPPSITRLYTADGRILDEFATENRIYSKYDEIPEVVINAFIAAEDKNFFKHEGIDPISIIRAALVNILNVGKNKNPVGGSTITQQVVKNFLLSNERTLSRKIKEAILSYRISNVYTKQKVMELYLNQLYLGNYSYGIASAALNYFNKELKDLKVEEAALLAALPKSPSYMNPAKNYDRAKARRDWVLSRMYDEDFITDEEYSRAVNTPIALKKRRDTDFYKAEYYSEAVRQELISKFGEDSVYNDGLQVYTNVNENLQILAEQALHIGLTKYDRKHGWRGALGHIDISVDTWVDELKKFPKPLDIKNYKLAVVLKVDGKSASIALDKETKGTIKLEKLSWARKTQREQTLGTAVKSVKDVLKLGDVILVSKVGKGSDEYLLEQIPDVNGAIVVLETNTGKVLAQVGGYEYKRSNFNRAIQADRQPGSSFKPILYLSALERGFDPRSILYDEPITINQGEGMPAWTPKNMKGDFLGPITLRKALEKSRNLATVWLLTKIGIDPIIEMSERLDVYKNPPRYVSMALGAFDTKVINLTNAFNIIASGGRRTEPYFIDRVYDRKGKLLYSSDKLRVIKKNTNDLSTYLIPELGYQYDQVIDEDTNYQMISILEGVMIRGTGGSARVIKRTLAGKTGTTNDSFDTWFIGFTPDITVGVYVGFDTPRTLGQREAGATLALPIFIEFMKEALKDIDDKKFEIPPGIRLVSIDGLTGQEPTSETNPKDIISEAIRKNPLDGPVGTIGEMMDIIQGSGKNSESHINSGFGGMY